MKKILYIITYNIGGGVQYQNFRFHDFDIANMCYEYYYNQRKAKGISYLVLGKFSEKFFHDPKGISYYRETIKEYPKKLK